MQKYKFRVRLPNGGETDVVITSNSRRNAEVAAEAQTGGKVMGGRQLPN